MRFMSHTSSHEYHFCKMPASLPSQNSTVVITEVINNDAGDNEICLEKRGHVMMCNLSLAGDQNVYKNDLLYTDHCTKNLFQQIILNNYTTFVHLRCQQRKKKFNLDQNL